MEKKKQIDYEEFKKDAFRKLNEGQSLTGKDGVLMPLIKDVLETSLNVELEKHLEESADSNRKNGHTDKTVKSQYGQIPIKNPRDRNSTFKPKLLPKRKSILNASLDEKILSLYGLGMSYGDIAAHLEEMYGLDVSKGTINAITDKIIPLVREWQARPLEQVYAFVWLDAFFTKVREEGVVRLKSVYCILGINIDGYKDILGMYLSESEGSKFWLNILADLKNRGVKDILIASIDGLKGFPDAIKTIFPATEIQLCIIHQIRNSLRYVTWKDAKVFMRDLKQVYKASSRELAEKRLDDIEEKWGAKYPIIFKSWRNNWNELSAYFKYPEEIRRVIYTTNIIEGYHRQLRKVIKTKGAFPNPDSLFKLCYVATMNIMKTWKRPIHNWNRVHSQLVILFESRMPLKLRM